MIKNNKRCTIVFLIALVLISISYAVILWHQNSKVKLININDMEHTSNLKFSIDKIKNSGEFIEISGWAFEPKRTLDNCINEVILKDTKSNYHKINTTNYKRSDLKKAFNDDNIENSGFHAKVDKKKLKSDNRYEIYIYYNNENQKLLVDTKQIISF